MENISSVQCGRLAFGSMEQKDAESLINNWVGALEDKPKEQSKPKKADPQAVFAKLAQFMPSG